MLKAVVFHCCSDIRKGLKKLNDFFPCCSEIRNGFKKLNQIEVRYNF